MTKNDIEIAARASFLKGVRWTSAWYNDESDIHEGPHLIKHDNTVAEPRGLYHIVESWVYESSWDFLEGEDGEFFWDFKTGRITKLREAWITEPELEYGEYITGEEDA